MVLMEVNDVCKNTTGVVQRFFVRRFGSLVVNLLLVLCAGVNGACGHGSKLLSGFRRVSKSSKH